MSFMTRCNDVNMSYFSKTGLNLCRCLSKCKVEQSTASSNNICNFFIDISRIELISISRDNS
ncbi:unnamed protein product [Brugia timori]|uniref:Apple domain-containing protein n=1 Tax=Brugia timori TaxID=42155 RepID=A0A0R3QDR1_9BILA|nr:unnamed protein product [Brugia timori]